MNGEKVVFKVEKGHSFGVSSCYGIELFFLFDPYLTQISPTEKYFISTIFCLVRHLQVAKYYIYFTNGTIERKPKKLQQKRLIQL